MKTVDNNTVFTCPCCGRKTEKTLETDSHKIWFEEKVGHTEIKPVPNRKIQVTTHYKRFCVFVCDKCWKRHTGNDEATSKYGKISYFIGILTFAYGIYHNYTIGALEEHPFDTISGSFIIGIIALIISFLIIYALVSLKYSEPTTTYERARKCNAIAEQ